MTARLTCLRTVAGELWQKINDAFSPLRRRSGAECRWRKCRNRPDVFLKNCASCHGKDGKGKTPIGRKLGAKDLAASKTTRSELEKQILEGRRDPKGVVKMPGFAGKFSDTELQQVVDYTLKLRP